jgi:hypothetical protein
MILDSQVSSLRLDPIPKRTDWLRVVTATDETQLWRWKENALSEIQKRRLEALNSLGHPCFLLPSLQTMANGELYLVEAREKLSLGEALERLDQSAHIHIAAQLCHGVQTLRALLPSMWRYHGQVCLDAISVSSSGQLKLGGFALEPRLDDDEGLHDCLQSILKSTIGRPNIASLLQKIPDLKPFQIRDVLIRELLGEDLGNISSNLKLAVQAPMHFEPAGLLDESRQLLLDQEDDFWAPGLERHSFEEAPEDLTAFAEEVDIPSESLEDQGEFETQDKPAPQQEETHTRAKEGSFDVPNFIPSIPKKSIDIPDPAADLPNKEAMSSRQKAEQKETPIPPEETTFEAPKENPEADSEVLLTDKIETQEEPQRQPESSEADGIELSEEDDLTQDLFEEEEFGHQRIEDIETEEAHPDSDLDPPQTFSTPIVPIPSEPQMATANTLDTQSFYFDEPERDFEDDIEPAIEEFSAKPMIALGAAVGIVLGIGWWMNNNKAPAEIAPAIIAEKITEAPRKEAVPAIPPIPAPVLVAAPIEPETEARANEEAPIEAKALPPKPKKKKVRTKKRSSKRQKRAKTIVATETELTTLAPPETLAPVQMEDNDENTTLAPQDETESQASDAQSTEEQLTESAEDIENIWGVDETEELEPLVFAPGRVISFLSIENISQSEPLPMFSLVEKAKWFGLSQQEKETLNLVPEDNSEYTKALTILLIDAQTRKNEAEIDSILKRVFRISSSQKDPVMLLAKAHHLVNMQDFGEALTYALQAKEFWNKTPEETRDILRLEHLEVLATAEMGQFYSAPTKEQYMVAIQLWESCLEMAREKEDPETIERAEETLNKLGIWGSRL